MEVAKTGRAAAQKPGGIPGGLPHLAIAVAPTGVRLRMIMVPSSIPSGSASMVPTSIEKLLTPMISANETQA